MSIPDGWTDDMNIPLPPGRTVEEVVELVIRNALAGVSDTDTEGQLAASFGLSSEAAALARDRTFGGIVRGATRNPENCPDRAKDPIAWTSFQRAMADPSIGARIYPQFCRVNEPFPGSSAPGSVTPPPLPPPPLPMRPYGWPVHPLKVKEPFAILAAKYSLYILIVVLMVGYAISASSSSQKRQGRRMDRSVALGLAWVQTVLTSSGVVAGVVSLFGIRRYGAGRILWRAALGITINGAILSAFIWLLFFLPWR